MSANILNCPCENLKVADEAATRISALADLIVILNESSISHDNMQVRQLCSTIFNKREHQRGTHNCQHNCRLREKITQGCYDEIEHIKRHTTKAIEYLVEDLEKHKYLLDNDQYPFMKSKLEFSLLAFRTYKHTLPHIRN